MNIGEKTERIVCSILHHDAKLLPLNSYLKAVSRDAKKDVKYINKKNRDAICGVFKEKFSSFDITIPSDGSSCSKRTTADILLYSEENEKSVGLSIKHNNMSIKHHRPHMLHKQMHLSSELSCVFQEDYARLQNKWLNHFAKYSFSQYNEMDMYTRMSMLNDFNVLTARWLNDNQAHMSKYINFIVDKQTPYILKVNTDGSADVYKKKRYRVFKPFVYVNYEKSSINIVLDSSSTAPISLCMRLHTCSRKIKNTIDIKFDVTAYGIFNKIT